MESDGIGSWSVEPKGECDGHMGTPVGVGGVGEKRESMTE